MNAVKKNRSIVLFISALTAFSVYAAQVLPTPGSTAGYLYFPAASSGTSGTGGSGGATVTGCYVGMSFPADTSLTPIPCEVGENVYSSENDNTPIGKYGGKELTTGKHFIVANDNSGMHPICSTGMSFISAHSETDGASNTNAIISFCSTGYSAAKICRQIGADWYLPAYRQLSVISANRLTLGVVFDTGYWSSTIDSGGRMLQIGHSNPISNPTALAKTSYNVRCIRDF